jgi:hypothetical protein
MIDLVGRQVWYDSDIVFSMPIQLVTFIKMQSCIFVYYDLLHIQLSLRQTYGSMECMYVLTGTKNNKLQWKQNVLWLYHYANSNLQLSDASNLT